jgi:hypothetical protein
LGTDHALSSRLPGPEAPDTTANPGPFVCHSSGTAAIPKPAGSQIVGETVVEIGRQQTARGSGMPWEYLEVRLVMYVFTPPMFQIASLAGVKGRPPRKTALLRK